MPAPPDESEPAMGSATGIVIAWLATRFVTIRSGSCPVLARRANASKFAWKGAPDSCFDAFSLREPVSTSLENAILRLVRRPSETTAMVPFFVQFKCKLGQSYAVANALAEAEIASEIYSTAGDYDLLVKFYVDNDTDIGHFVNEKVQIIPGIQDTHTIITFKAFGTG